MVEGVPVLAVPEMGEVCLSFGRNREFGASCMDVSADSVDLVSSASGMAPKGAVAGSVPKTVTQVRIERDGEHIADIKVTDTSFGRFFAAEVPGEGTYRVIVTMEDGATYGSVDLEVREDATMGVSLEQGEAEGP